MRRIAIFYLYVITLTIFGQDAKPTKPTLSITGFASIRVKPDIGILKISVSEIRLNMSDAIKTLEEKSNYYNSLLIKLGFAEKDIKTTSFDVSTNSYYSNGRMVDSGYVASQNIKLEFVYTQQTLQKIVTAFSKSEKPIDFTFEFILSEEVKQKVQSNILEVAIKDATEKAAIISKASKVKLVNIKSISYGVVENTGGMVDLDRIQSYTSSVGNYTPQINTFNFIPNDMTFRDAVLMEWVIE